MDRREFIRKAALVVIFGSISALAFLEAIGKLAPAAPSVIETIGGGGGNQTQTQAQTGVQTSTQSRSPTQSQSQTRTQSQSQTQTQTQTTTQGQQPPAGYVYVAPVSALSGKTSAYFNHPTGGLSILVYFGGQWRAFSAVCTHAGCTVQFTGSEVYCPCHAGYFSASNGAVVSGPPPTPLAEYGVVVQNGDLYVSQNVIS